MGLQLLYGRNDALQHNHSAAELNSYPARDDMGKTLLLLILVFGIVSIASAQRKPTHRAPGGRISKQSPSVYIRLERIAKISSPENGEIEERVWLRLHNNTRWVLWHNAHGWSSKEYGDGGLFYDIENIETHEIKIGNRCHACSFIPLASGRSFFFSIPRVDLEKDSRIRIKFWWEWQDQDGVFGGREFENWVYFNSDALSKTAR